MEKNIAVCLRLVITKGDEILLTKVKGGDFYFLPGGGLEFNESIEEAISRELKEELGINLKSTEFIGINETRFTDKNGVNHGIDLIFKVEVDKLNDVSKEDHISFGFNKISEIPNLNILPGSLKKSLINWFNDQKNFWGK